MLMPSSVVRSFPLSPIPVHVQTQLRNRDENPIQSVYSISLTHIPFSMTHIVYTYRYLTQVKLITDILTAQKLSENPTLTHLELYQCGIDADGMTKLGAALKNKPLQHLNLGENPIELKGTECLGKCHTTSCHSRHTPHAK